MDALIHAENFVKSDKNTRQLNMELRDAYIDYLGPRVHPAALNRVKELEYIQSVVASLVPHLFCKFLGKFRDNFDVNLLDNLS